MLVAITLSIGTKCAALLFFTSALRLCYFGEVRKSLYIISSRSCKRLLQAILATRSVAPSKWKILLSRMSPPRHPFVQSNEVDRANVRQIFSANIKPARFEAQGVVCYFRNRKEIMGKWRLKYRNTNLEDRQHCFKEIIKIGTRSIVPLTKPANIIIHFP